MTKAADGKKRRSSGLGRAPIGNRIVRLVLVVTTAVAAATLAAPVSFADVAANAALLSAQILLTPVCNDGRCENFDRSCRSCAQPSTTGNAPKGSDALAVLRAAVGEIGCARCICDVDGNNAIQATDALVTLRRAVGQAVQLNCPQD